jgi:hypothetical protein
LERIKLRVEKDLSDSTLVAGVDTNLLAITAISGHSLEA